MKKVEIYTDGACSGNPGPGGYGAILVYKGKKLEISGGYRLTTNNRMELMAVIAAMSALKEPCEADLYSDSRYVVDAVNKGWVKKWRENNWMRNKDEKASNPDLWEKALRLLDIHNINFIWIKGHAENPGNERCDEIARETILRGDLPDDSYYIINNS